MAKVHSLLGSGNTKLGEGIATFSLPAVSTCPGSTPTCRADCYATKGNFLFAVSAYKRNLVASKADNFAPRMIAEVRRRFAGCVRIHVAGDFYSPDYVEKWLTIVHSCPDTRFYAYTRSWRVPEMVPGLSRLSRLRNMRLWYSCDRDTGTPSRIPKRVRLAYMQAGPEDMPSRADLVFRVKRLRRKVAKRIALALVCPVENGVTKGVTCGSCRVCID